MNRPFLPLLPLLTSLTIGLAAIALPAQTPAAPKDPLALGKMWTFENQPLAYLEKEYGFKPDESWLQRLRLGALRLGERENPWCSASFVSPKGLIMTNHHCVRDTLSKNQGATNWLKHGFAASALEDEVQLEDLTVHQLIAQQDVTARVNEGVAEGDDDAAATSKRDANIAAIVKAAQEQDSNGLFEVVTLYQGAVYQLYSYKVYDDVRLVLAPELAMPHFGGDHDNFTFPRWSIDFSFLRAYENGQPADTSASYFRWRQEGAKDGELVFVPGNPGKTTRLQTTAQLEFSRDIEFPIMLEQMRDEMAALRPFAARVPQLATTLLGIENGYKSVSGTQRGLHDEALMAKKREFEQDFKARVAADPKLQAAYGDVWDRIAELANRQRSLQPRVAFHSPGYSLAIECAVQIARAADPALGEEERKKALDAALAIRIQSNALVERLLADMFTRARRWLPKDDAYLAAVLGTEPGGDAVEPRALAQRLQLRLSQVMIRELADGGLDALRKHELTALAAGAALAPLQAAAEKEQEEIDAALKAQGVRIGRALHAVYGNQVSPDATMTLRFSDGRVAGYECNGTLAPWATSFYGLFARSVEFGNEEPFEIADTWADARDRIDMTRRVCFVSTNDIVGGNSGSAMVDRDLRVVGLIFDGNIESLPNDFYYTQTKARAVSVHTDAIVEALTKVYPMQRIADELLAK